MIREATVEDLPDLMVMGKRFHDASGLPGSFSALACGAFVAALIDSPAGAVFRSDKGVIMGALTPSYCAPDWKMAVEMAWWAEDGKGLALLKRFEEWARDTGANEIRMTSLANLAEDRVRKIFERAGYAPAEISFRKVI